jgi:hypothetical protein
MDIVTGKGISPSNELTKVGALLSGVTNVMSDTTVKSIRFAGIPLRKRSRRKRFK